MFKCNQLIRTLIAQKNVPSSISITSIFLLDHHQQQQLHQPNSCNCNLLKICYYSSCAKRDQQTQFKLNKALIVTKLSRLEFEQYRHPNLTHKNELEQIIRNRGTDYDAMLYYHNLHKDFERKVADSFKQLGVKVELVNRVSLTKNKIKWADMLVPVGGDGTFLLAAGRASPLFPDFAKTPIVGFNSDPLRSEGQLMLPKEYSMNPREAVTKILACDFKWMHRSRIRVTLLGENGNIPQSTDLHEHTFEPMERIDLPPEKLNAEDANRLQAKMKRVLPYLALNEVFIGETLSARVSHLQLSIDDISMKKMTKTKSSGLCVSTGTGSTSWLTSINRLSAKNIEKLIKIIESKSNGSINIDSKSICDEYNKQLIFPPDDPRLCYSIREQICIGVWPNPKGFNSKGFARTLLIKSRCIDASLVIDGSISYPFNDGAKALLEVHPNDSLLTIAL